MKNAITLFAAFLALTVIDSHAQDRIKTIDGRTIEAKILEINDEIVYKEYNYQDGPTYRIKIDEVISIVLQNGTERVFTSIPEGITFPSSINISRGDVYGDGAKIAMDNLPYILGKEGYRSYTSASTLRRISTPLFIAGAGTAGFGTVMLITLPLMAKYDLIMEVPPALLLCSYILVGVGLTSIVTAIPLRIISNSKYKNVVNYYNKKYHPSLAFGMTSNGVGLSLTF